jgi:hypothetical protein
VKQDAFWANDPVAAPARPQPAPAPTRAPASTQFWANDPVAAPSAPAAPRRAPTGGGRQPAPAAPAVDEYATPMIRDVQRTAAGTTYTMVPLGPEDTPESLTASGRYFNPTTNAWEFPRELEDVEVQGGVEGLPMVPAAAPQGMFTGEELGIAPLVSGTAGVARGLHRVIGGAYGLFGQAADRIGMDSVGNAMIDQANAYQNAMDVQNAPFRARAPIVNQTGQFVGEVAATAPVGGVVGRGISLAGQGVGQVAPRVGQGLEALGRSTAAGGFLPSAVRPPAAGAAPVIGERLLNLGTRGAGGAISGGTQAALINEDDAAAGAAIGALLPTVAARPAKYALNQLLNGFDALTGTLGRARASEIVRQSLGVDYDVAVAALRNAGPDVTAQQALVGAGVEPSAFMGVGAAVRAASPDPYIAIDAAQAAARQAPIDRLAGGANLTEAQLSQRAEKTALRRATALPRGMELAIADASGALDVTPVSAALMAQADAPGVGTTNSRVLAEIAVGLDALAARRGGVASAQDLYAFRKDDLDDIISRSLSGQRGGDITSQAARRSELVRSAQQMLDDAIVAAGGTGWRRYLEAYASGSDTIRRQAMMGVAGRQLRNNPNAFANLVEGETPDVVSGVFGGNRIDLANLMNPTGVGPSGMDALTDAARQIRRDERVGVLAGEGRGVAQELLQQSARGPVRRLLNLAARARPGAAAAMDFGSMLLDAEVAPQVRRELAQAYQSGANMDELLAVVPSASRAQIARNMMNPAFWSHLTGAGANVMADPSANAMSPPPQ